MNEYFYGWYFRCQGEDGTFAVIPAVHISDRKKTCSIQVITETGSWNQLETDRGTMKISGILRFGELKKPRYDIMGPFRYIPAMECRHAVYSMSHSVDGEIMINGKLLRFCQGKGYMEGDSGTSFPEQYAWTQHFLKDGSLMLAAAAVPLAGLRFTGTIGMLFRKGREYRFATYLGASIRKMSEDEIVIRQGKYRLKARFPSRSGNVLRAPQKGEMTRRVRESVSSRAEYTLLYKDRVVFRIKTDQAAVEYETKEEEYEDISNHSRENQGKIFKRRYHRIQ